MLLFISVQVRIQLQTLIIFSCTLRCEACNARLFIAKDQVTFSIRCSGTEFPTRMLCTPFKTIAYFCPARIIAFSSLQSCFFWDLLNRDDIPIVLYFLPRPLLLLLLILSHICCYKTNMRCRNSTSY